MIPGMNPRDMKKAMKRMGIKQQEIDASEVIIKTADKDIVISNPQVSKVNMMGQEMFQIIGQVTERSAEKFSDADVKTVSEQAGVDEETAKSALENADGDLAKAIMELT